MAEHTPGPWSVEHDEDADTISIVNFGGEIAVLHGVSMGENDESDARLIAAAPDLLAALEAVTPFVVPEALCLNGRDYLAALDAISDARRAIARARGEG